ncbi:PIN domain-like protein [Fomitopsis betulina]|nr:PIN domain-like protein [Fomitopsis betulina]
MGVNGLWEIVKPASTVEDLETYFVHEGFEDEHGGQFFRLGIDASIWFHQVQLMFAIGHAQSGENPELQTLFYRIERLLRLPVHAIFVFDGPERPSTKRGTCVVPTGHWMVTAMKELINAFGFIFITAPAEAEAELTLLNKLGHINGVLTDDSDVFLFGARTVIQNYTAKDTTIMVTTSRLIEENKSVALTGPSMVFIALLTGGDYNNGLPSFGKCVTHGLAHYGFRVNVFWQGSIHITDFLPSWCDEIRHALHTDESGHLGRHYPMLSQQIPDSWPDGDALANYLNPMTSSPEDLEYSWPQPPNIAHLGQLCEQYFSWGTRAGITKHFASCLVLGVVTRILIFRTLNHDTVRQAKGVGLYQDDFKELLCLKFQAVMQPSGCPQQTHKVTSCCVEYRFSFIGSVVALWLSPQ